MPVPLHLYNKCLSGVDLFNPCLANYYCTIRKKMVVASSSVES